MRYIYMIQFPNWKVYIGQTNNLKIRIGNHKRCKSKQPKLVSAIRKYGWDNLQIRILCVCTEDKVDEMERNYIKAYASNEVGYNLESGGSKNKTHSEETKRKIGLKSKGRTQSKEERMKKSISHKGRKFSDAHKINLSKSKYGVGLGRKHSEETKQKMRDKALGRKFTEEHKLNMIKNHADVSGKNNPNFKTGKWIVGEK